MIAPGLYRHYKGALYRVIGTVRDSTNGPGEGREMVLYISDAEHGFHVRERSQFTEYVATDEVHEGVRQFAPRFQRVRD